MGVTDILEHYDDFFVVVLKGYFRNSKCLKFHYGVDIFYARKFSPPTGGFFLAPAGNFFSRKFVLGKFCCERFLRKIFFGIFFPGNFFS